MADHQLTALTAQQLTHPAKAAIARSMFQTDDAEQICQRLAQYCSAEFGQVITGCALAYFSVGATFVVQLSDGVNIVLKAYGSRQSLAHLTASFRLQQQLALAGFACPRVLRMPRTIDGVVLTVQSVIDAGERVPSRAEFVRRSMASKLAELMQTTAGWSGEGLSIWMDLDQPGLWHRSHNVLFDLPPTAATAWIDDIAAEAKAVLRSWSGPWTIGHSDWSLQNMSFRNGQLVGVLDWESLRLGPEIGFLGGAARCFRHDWRDGPPETAITVQEVRGFIREYERARGWTCSAQDWRFLGAAVAYTAAYGVRCAFNGGDMVHYERAKQQLLAFTDEFLM